MVRFVKFQLYKLTLYFVTLAHQRALTRWFSNLEQSPDKVDKLAKRANVLTSRRREVIKRIERLT